MDAEALPVLVTRDFPHELLIGSDAISQGNGEIDYGARKVTSFGQNFSITPYTDFIPHTASVWELLPPLHQWRHEGIQTFFDEDLFNLGPSNLITFTIKPNGCWPIKLRAYCTPLGIRKVVDQRYNESGYDLDFNITMAVTFTPKKDESYLDQCCFVYIDDIILYSINAFEHIYHLRLVSERLSESGMKIKPDDGEQNSMTYSSESEGSEHSLARGVIQYIYYIFSILVSSLHAVEAYIRHRPIRAEFYSILLFYFILFFYCNLWLLFRAMHSAIVILAVAFIPLCKGIKFCFAWKKCIFYPNLSAILDFRVRNMF